MAVIDRKKFWQCVNIDWKLIGLVKYLVYRVFDAFTKHYRWRPFEETIYALFSSL